MREPDRQLFRIAVPALGALVAEPLFMLSDTAIVGHLGTRPLAALAAASTVLGTLVGLCNFLAYATTAFVARLAGRGDIAGTRALAGQAVWAGLGVGTVVLVVVQLLAPTLLAAVGVEAGVADDAERFLRIASLGVPGLILGVAAQGVLRGLADLRRPLVVLGVGSAANVVLNATLVYGFDLGLTGSAIGTAVSQAGMGVAFALLLTRAAGGLPRPRLRLLSPLLTTGGLLVLRTAALLCAFVASSAVLARHSAASLAAHQILYGLYVLLALVLDAMAIAVQVLIGRRLGAGDRAGATALGRRAMGWCASVGGLMTAVLLALHDVVPRLFTDAPDVLDETGRVWLVFALLLPVGGVVFALDGILIGAADARFALASTAAGAVAFLPVALLAHRYGWGIRGVWAAMAVLIAVRAVAAGARFAHGGWTTAADATGITQPAPQPAG